MDRPVAKRTSHPRPRHVITALCVCVAGPLMCLDQGSHHCKEKKTWLGDDGLLVSRDRRRFLQEADDGLWFSFFFFKSGGDFSSTFSSLLYCPEDPFFSLSFFFFALCRWEARCPALNCDAIDRSIYLQFFPFFPNYKFTVHE